MLLAFFLSGAAALTYQIVWARQLALVFGVTIYATSAVVTAFMAGLALGSLYFGRVVDRWRRPLELFALLQLGIAAFAVLFPLVTDGLTHVYVALYGPFGGSHYVMSLFRFSLSFLVLLVPTSLMGGTLPVLARAYVSQAGRLGREVAGLYSVNNLGAFVGCVLAGYAFLELFGLTGTLALAAGLNLLAALLTIGLDLRLKARGAGAPAAPTTAEPEPTEHAALPGAVKVALWVFAIEGFTSLAYQMAWMRMLFFFVRSNVYAISAIVATFVAGLSIGAYVVRWRIDRSPDPYRLLGLIEVGVALTALATIPLLPWMVASSGQLRDLFPPGWFGSTLMRFAVCSLVILAPTCFMGATMPVAARIYVPLLRRLGRKMGLIGCLDTVGSVFGAFAGGFVLIPLLGIQRTIIAMALVNLALAVWVFAVDPVARPRGRRLRLASAAGLLLLTPALLLLRPVPLVRGVVGPEQEILFYREGVEATVSVTELYGSLPTLWVNESWGAQAQRHDWPSHAMIAHTPLLLHPGPKRVLLIGLGIGYTARTCRVHGVEVDVVELAPGVREAARLFDEVNHGVLDDAHVNVRIEDGRNYMLGADRQYDFIQAGVLHPGLNPGNGAFYTVDFYRQARRKLAPGGILSQWLPLHDMPHADFRMLVRSFQEAFPHASVWFKHTADFCTLVGTQGPLEVDFARVERRMADPAVRDHLALCDVVNVYDLLDSFCTAGLPLRQAVGPGLLYTDERPYLEFHASRPFPHTEDLANLRMLVAMRRPVWPRLTNVPAGREQEVRAELARWFAGTNHVLRAQVSAFWLAPGSPATPESARLARAADSLFEMALQINPDDANARFLRRSTRAIHGLMLGRRLLREGRREEARPHLKEVAEMGPEVRASAVARRLYETSFSGPVE
jgi:spermidine synthase